MEKKTVYRVHGIKWDTDGESPSELGLPETVDVEAFSEDEVADALSDHYGWRVESMRKVEVIAYSYK